MAGHAGLGISRDVGWVDLSETQHSQNKTNQIWRLALSVG
jgi:hypothetical protein